MEIKSVKQISLELKDKIEKEFNGIWIKGELSQVKTHSSGHVYFSLKEDEYVISGICWKGTPISCILEDGIIVECFGKITTYASRSSYQIIIKEARKVNQIGNILIELEKLKKKLQEEGIFNNKKIIKKINEKIAIITSPTGAVFHDFMHRINQRFPCCTIFFYSVNVQGESSIPGILKALEHADLQNYDIIVLARGGGSLEDLWIFNNEILVRFIANMKSPVITAIGHETDTTLVDFASSLRAPTPTAAAEFITLDKNELIDLINLKINNLNNMFLNKIKDFNYKLNLMSNNKDILQSKIDYLKQKLDFININFIDKINNKIQKYLSKIGNLDNFSFIFNNLIQKITNINSEFKNKIFYKLDVLNKLFINKELMIQELNSQLNDKIIIKVNNKKINFLSQIHDEFEIITIENSIKAKKI